jgi:hypothetical protein
VGKVVYAEVGSGGITIRGCAATECLRRVVTQFNEGDVLFNVAKARRGILEKVVIKRVRRVTSSGSGAQRVALYEDTLNGLWNEYDLVVYEQAVELIQNYLNALEAAWRALKC